MQPSRDRAQTSSSSQTCPQLPQFMVSSSTFVQRPLQMSGQASPHVVVVVDVVAVVVVFAAQLGPLAGDAQASQQLRHVPTVPCFFVHDSAFFLVEHFVPLAPGMQHVTAPGLPHVDFAAHFLTAPLQLGGRLPASARSFTACAMHRTYAP